MITKVCRKCGIEKPISDFYNSDRYRDGHTPYCKQCMNKEYAKYYEEYKNTTNYRILKLKSKSNSRGLGFIELNEYRKGWTAHHIDDMQVVYIPSEIHSKCNHSDKFQHREKVINLLIEEGYDDLAKLILDNMTYDKENDIYWCKY